MLRRRIGIVFQDYQLLTDRNVFMNLYYVMKATGGKNESEIRKRIDEVLKVVSLEAKGYKMPFELSGGAQQRLVIARALLKDAPILILDDSVSAVDTRTEKIILDNLKKSRAGKTTLLIAHRISTVERLDKIIFLEDGRVEAVGPHDQLYASCPEYRKMVDLLKLEDEGGGGNA